MSEGELLGCRHLRFRGYEPSVVPAVNYTHTHTYTHTHIHTHTHRQTNSNSHKCREKLAISLVVFEEAVAEVHLSAPVWVGCVFRDPLSVQPDTVGLGVHSETLLSQNLLYLTHLPGFLLRPAGVCVCVCEWYECMSESVRVLGGC